MEECLKDIFIKETDYKEMMTRTVEPYLEERKTEIFAERETGRTLYCARYVADAGKGVVLISHGFTETSEKYIEGIYYFLKAGYHVFCMEHCGHGRSYRLSEDLSLVHVESYERYVEDLLYIARLAKKEYTEVPLFLYAHSMGGGIGAAAAAKEPELFDGLVLSSPMIRPATGKVPWGVARVIAEICCLLGKGKNYVAGQTPYHGKERFEDSASTSGERFAYYQEKREKTPLYQMNAASYGWLRSAGKLNHFLKTEGVRRIQTPVLLFQAEEEYFVSKEEQKRFIKKLGKRSRAKLIRVPGTKHEIYNSEDKVVRNYWKRIFEFLDSRPCRLCPRDCGADRKNGQAGVCGVSGTGISVSRAALHMWEEPCISGESGSGAVFFSGCPLRCVYCQNYQIAHAEIGMEISVERLAEIFIELQEKKAANINLVTPTHYTPEIRQAVMLARNQGLTLPVVYNCSGYEKVETLRSLEGIVDIYLTDYKYMEEETSARYSKAADYPRVAKAALAEMVRQQGVPVFNENGMMKRGVIVRHLLLPGHVKNAKAVVKYLYETYGNSIYISLMNQYTPLPQVKEIPELNRRVTKREYNRLTEYALELGLENGFIQEGKTAEDSFIPAFDYEGII